MKGLTAYLIILLTGFMFISGCKKSNNILFCEGVDTEGKGVNCGIKFETGDLTAIVKDKEVFNSEKISLEIYEDENKKEKIESLSVSVDPEKKSATATLSFYVEGRFSVKALKEGKSFADGKIEIVDY